MKFTCDIRTQFTHMFITNKNKTPETDNTENTLQGHLRHGEPLWPSILMLSNLLLSKPYIGKKNKNKLQTNIVSVFLTHAITSTMYSWHQIHHSYGPTILNCHVPSFYTHRRIISNHASCHRCVLTWLWIWTYIQYIHVISYFVKFRLVGFNKI